MPTSEPDTTTSGGRGADDADAVLAVRDVYAGYAGFDILHGVSLHVGKGEIVCVVGPNGSGKSTVFKAIYGLIGVRQGDILFQGEDISNRRPQQLLQTGIAMVPQQPSVFHAMTVRENLELGMYLVRDKQRIKERIEHVFELFPRLADRRSQNAGTLSGGERRALEISRALMLDPTLVLMDEPSVGLSPILVRGVFEQIAELREQAGLTFLLIEQNARSGLELCDRGYVLDQGRIAYADTGSALLADEEVRRAFLGG
jgi:ABC-type branched-subunit amino acid transport system ATPase component